MYRKSRMKKEAVLIKLGRVLSPRTVKLSNWHVDEAIRIPIRAGRVPVPLWSPLLQERAIGQHTRLKRCVGAFVAVALGLCLSLSANATQSASIAWNPSTDPTTSGYAVYASTSTNGLVSSQNQLMVGNNTTITFSGLREGSTLYFAVSAVNGSGVVGMASAPISYIVPGKMMMVPGSGSNRGSMTFPTAPGHYYQVEASTNLTSWSVIYQTPTATSNVWLTYQDPQASSFPKRFYRLIMH
jgi:hypothetical protein